MMKLTVRYFALFREQVGRSEEQVETTAADVAALFAQLQQRHSGLQSFEQMKVAVNDELVGFDQALRDGDTVLYFPPVAGG